MFFNKSDVFLDNDIFVYFKKIANDLTILVEKENVVLRNGKFPNSAFFHKKTTELEKLNNIEYRINNFLKTNSIDKTSKSFQSFITSLKKLREQLSENEILLLANLEISKKIIELYQAKKIDQYVDMFGYNEKGSNSIINNIEEMLPSFSLNDKI